jgi:hypothetical protein
MDLDPAPDLDLDPALFFKAISNDIKMFILKLFFLLPVLTRDIRIHQSSRIKMI